MEDKNNIEELREKLHRHILQYGRDSPEALKISQELDRLIVEEMRKQISDNTKS